MTKLMYRLASIALVSAVALLFGPTHSTAQERGQRGGADAPLVNVQVLKGMNRGQIIQEMMKINAQLGVACTFCHVQKDGRNDFPADDKQHKVIAREMMKLVQAINEQAALKTVSRTVECWTCHRGAAGIPNPPLPPAQPQGGPGGGGRGPAPAAQQ